MSNPAYKVVATNPTQDEWLKLRGLGVGGSDAPAVMGHDKYSGPFALYLAKVGDPDPEGEKAGDYRSEAAYWGTVLEDVIATEFAKRTGWAVWHPHTLIRSLRWPWMQATLDRVVAEVPASETHGELDPESFLEIKTTSAHNWDLWDSAIPERVNDQVQHCLAVTGWDHAWVAVLIGGQEYKQFRVERDDRYIDLLVSAERDFWEAVLRREPPRADGLQTTSDYLDKVHPVAVELRAELDPMVGLTLGEYRRLREQRDKAALGMKEIENQVKVQLGDAGAGYVGGIRVVTWVEYVQERVDTEAVRKLLGDQLPVKRSLVRKFRVLGEEDGE